MVIGIASIYLSDLTDGGETDLKQVGSCPTMPHNAPQCPNVGLPDRIYRDNDALVR